MEFPNGSRSVRQDSASLSRPHLAWLILFLAVPLASQKQDGCANASTQMQMDACSKEGFDLADRELNQAYSAAQRALGPEDRARLTKAEKSWLAYRDDDCAAEASLYEGGSIKPTIKTACLDKLSRERTVEIKRIYEQFLKR
jgi:uncharacterized protein YecT (DUF1311 family)